MRYIDSHQHFWIYESIKYEWIGESMKVLQRDYDPIELKRIYDDHNVESCVAVQARGIIEETDFLLNLAKQNQFIKGVVGWFDLRDDWVEESLETYSDSPLLKGVRHIVQSEPVGFLDRDDFRMGISLLEKYNLVYDILIFPAHLPESIRLVKDYPNQIFVVDHMAKPNIQGKEIDQWRRDIKQLASFDNVYCKVSGLVTEAKWDKWTPEDFSPYLETAVEAFGVNRLMFGSDWPVCLLAASYSEVLNLIENYFLAFSENERSALFRYNAENVYHL